MNIYKLISNQLKERIQEIPEIHNVATSDDLQNIVVEVPKIREFGDFSTNAAMVLAKSLKKNPRQIAEILMTNIQSLSFVKDVSIAGPGFININVSDELWVELLSYILKKPDEYGNSDVGGNEKINVEFLSANPTGPLHIGHARGAILGDVLSRLLKKNGYDVTKEYYINDYGHQVVIQFQNPIVTAACGIQYLLCPDKKQV